jgi:DNA-binding HxlR family transcriptional regulator
MARVYNQHCGLAHALDLIGERWSLLIVRELLAGPRRYTDLQGGLVGIPTNVLAGRLREMEAGGLLHKHALPAPASSVVVYELTPEGESLTGVVDELARWGMRTLAPTTEGRPFRAHWLVLALRASFDAIAAKGVSESYEFTIEGDDVISFTVSNGEGRASVGAAERPAVRIKADADTFLALTADALDGVQAFERGPLIEGSPAAIARMRRILPNRRLATAATAVAGRSLKDRPGSRAAPR